ncbi:MAG: CBS domain-containing protein [Candidatus Micrarchaeia archaeon]
MLEDLLEEAMIVEGDQPLSKIIPNIKEKCVIVKEKNKYIGVVDDRILRRKLRAFAFSDRTKVKGIAQKAPLINGNEPLWKIASLFVTTGLRALPFEKEGKVEKVLRREKFLSFIAQKEKQNIQKVKAIEVATIPVKTIEGEATIAEALKKMRELGINRLVVEEEKGFGIITSFDIAKRLMINKSRTNVSFIEERRSTLQTKVKEFMQKDVKTINYDSSVEEAIQKMLSNNISSLVVVHGSKPIGILTIRDILEKLFISTSSEAKVEVIAEDERSYAQREEIRNELIKILKRFEGVEGLLLRIKKGRLYELKLSVFIKNKKIFIQCKNYKLYDALNECFSLLKKEISSFKEFQKDKIEKRKRIQSSVELLITVGIALGILLPIILVAYSQASASSLSLNSVQAYATAQKIASVAAIVGAQGEPTQQTIQVFIPPRVHAIYIGSKTSVVGNSITIQLETTGGLSDITAYSPVNVSGTINYLGPGTYFLTVKAYNYCPLKPSVSCVFINSTV